MKIIICLNIKKIYLIKLFLENQNKKFNSLDGRRPSILSSSNDSDSEPRLIRNYDLQIMNDDLPAISVRKDDRNFVLKEIFAPPKFSSRNNSVGENENHTNADGPAYVVINFF